MSVHQIMASLKKKILCTDEAEMHLYQYDGKNEI